MTRSKNVKVCENFASKFYHILDWNYVIIPAMYNDGLVGMKVQPDLLISRHTNRRSHQEHAFGAQQLGSRRNDSSPHAGADQNVGSCAVFEM
ncbi:MAG: hypothetical protein C0614_02835 [Desulfuromonas sp.]|nr:MAG: hypothetical protein C0614_02835 [Desulfuromonas sp.]